MKTLKYEEVYRTEYLDFADARSLKASITRSACTRPWGILLPPNSSARFSYK
jgi:hypothetical protein